MTPLSIPVLVLAVVSTAMAAQAQLTNFSHLKSTNFSTVGGGVFTGDLIGTASSASAVGELTPTAITNLIDTRISEVLGDAVLTETTGSNVVFNVSQPVAFPDGIVGVDYYMPMAHFYNGTAARVHSESTVIGKAGSTPNSVALPDGADPSNNFVEYACILPPHPLRINDPVITFNVWETSLKTGCSIFALSYLCVTNGMRVDNATKTTCGMVTNFHMAVGAGQRSWQSTVTITNAGTNFTNPNVTTFIVRLQRTADGFPVSVAVDNGVILKVRK